MDPLDTHGNALPPFRASGKGDGDRTTVFDLLVKSRIIYLMGEIAPGSADQVVALLLYLEQEDSEEDIKLYINSPGGSITATLAIYDTMQLVAPDVSTFCVGLAASGAAVLLAGGAKGKRYALPNSRVMIHQPLGMIPQWTQTSDIEITARELLRDKRRLYQILSEHTGQTYDKLSADCERDYHMTAEEAREYGVIDYVIDRATRSQLKD